MRQPRPRRLRAFLAAAVVPALSACARSDEPSRVPGVTRADSAGVEIVVNAVTAAAVPVFATVDSVPALRIGALAGRREEQFGFVSDVEPLRDGGAAVLDGQAAEIRLFDSDGAYRMSLGSKGQGPGELQSPSVLAVLPGDTLAVYDARPRRITRFGPDGALGRITTLEDTRGQVLVALLLPDGRLLGQSRWLDSTGGVLPGEGPAFVRDTVVLMLFSTDGSLQDTIDILPSREAVQSIQVGDGSVSVIKRTAAFGRTNVFAGHPDGIWSSSNDRFELRLLELGSGRLIRIVRAPGLEEPITEELARAIQDRAVAEAGTPDELRWAEAWYALSPRPETKPAYDRVVVDDQARVWVRTWSAPEPATLWWVFDGGGDLLGSVDVPRGMTLTAVRCGWAWGVEHDEFDVGYVVRYALRGVNGC